MSPLAPKVFKQQNSHRLRKPRHHWRQTLKGSNRLMLSEASLLLHAKRKKVSRISSALGKANRTWMRPGNTSSLSNQQPDTMGETLLSVQGRDGEHKPSVDQLFPFSTDHLVLKQNTTSINGINALEFTIHNVTDVKNRDGCKLGSCLHADRDSGGGLPCPEPEDDTMARHQCPEAKQSRLWARCHQPRVSLQSAFRDNKG